MGSYLGVLVLLLLMGLVRTLLLCLLLPISLRKGVVVVLIVALTLTISLWVVRVPKPSYLRSPQAFPQFLDPIKPAIWSELLCPVKC